jgi:hypothetical protein
MFTRIVSMQLKPNTHREFIGVPQTNCDHFRSTRNDAQELVLEALLLLKNIPSPLFAHRQSNVKP